MRAARRAAVGLYRRGPGPVHAGGRVLRRDGDAAGPAGKRGQERAGPRGARTGRRGRASGPAGASGGSGIPGSTPTRTNRTARSGTSCGRRSTRSRPRRSGTRRCGCWSTGNRSASISREWTARGIKPVAAQQWWPTSIVGTLTSPRLAGLREWQGQKYPATQWPAIIDADTHERLVKLFGDPARRKHVVRAPAHLLSGIATCPQCGRGLHYRQPHERGRADSYACVKARPGAAGRRSKRTCWRST